MKIKQLLILAAVSIGLPAQAQATFPVTIDIPDAAAFANWTVIDNNAASSANTWAYNDGDAIYTEDTRVAADDWLIAPAVTLEGGVTYTIDYYIVQLSTYSFDKQKYAITVGTDATIAAQATILTKNESFNTKTYGKQSTNFTPAETGTYYLGVHLYSASYNGNCGFQKFVVNKATVLPAQVSDLSVAAGAAGALEATLSWTMPSTSNYGGTLAELTGARIYRGTDLLATVNGTVGEAMTYVDQTISAAGTYAYSVVAFNNDGDAPGDATAVTSPWIGNDTPAAVTGLTASASGENVSLTWTAPSAGTHGGYIDASALAYRIVRGSDVLEQAWTGQLPYQDQVGQLARYTYTVYPIFDGNQGASASTSVLAGSAFEVPYTQNFDAQADFEFFTTFSSTARTWTYYSSKKLAQYWENTSNADAWLITPDIRLEEGKTYKLSFQAGLESASSSNNYKDLYVTIGQGKNATDQSTALWNEQIQSAIMSTKEVYLTVPADGNYNIGFRVLGQSNSYAVFVDNISIEESLVTPAAVSDLAVAEGAQGLLEATLTWTNPSLDVAGAALESLTKVVISRDGNELATIDAPAVGGQMQYVDNTITDNGIYTYSVVPYVDDRAGAASEVTTAWVGLDEPAAPTNVTLANVNDQPVITWTAPTVGVNGGYIDPSMITYNVERMPGSVQVASELQGTSFTDTEALPLGNYSYIVYTVCGESTSEGAQSNAMIFGGSLELPYTADFTDANHMALWTIVDANNDGKSWTYSGNAMQYTSMAQADDYAFTPPFNAPRGTFRLTYTVKGYSYRYSDAYEVVLTNTTAVGSAAGAPARAAGEPYSEVIQTVEQNAVESSMYKEQTVEFDTPDADDYYIGFHNVSTDSWGLYIGSVNIEVVEIPTGITNVTTLPNVKGVTYVNAAGQVSTRPFEGVNIVVTELTDGSRHTSKMVK